MLIVVVVLPTPPFWFATAITRGMTAASCQQASRLASHHAGRKRFFLPLGPRAVVGSRLALGGSRASSNPAPLVRAVHEIDTVSVAYFTLNPVVVALLSLLSLSSSAGTLKQVMPWISKTGHDPISSAWASAVAIQPRPGMSVAEPSDETPRVAGITVLLTAVQRTVSVWGVRPTRSAGVPADQPGCDPSPIGRYR